MTRYLSSFGCSVLFHAAVVRMLLWLLSPGDVPAVVTPPPQTAMAAFVVPREDPTYPGLNPLDPGAGEQIGPLAPDERMVSVGGFTFDAGKIAAHATVLFPFVTPGLSLDHFALSRGERRTLLFERPKSPARQRASTPERPLALSESTMQALVDKAWSRRERWQAFEPIRVLATRHSADAGALPLLFQRYTDQDALQPYQDQAIRDPRFWAQLGLAADHVRFIGFIREFAAAHPGTRGSIELLFLLDRIAEASGDALTTLLAYNPEEDLRWTREANRPAYRLALQLLHHYRSELSRRGLYSKVAVALYYDRVRLEILDGIIRSAPAGYRVSDARFLMGAIFWKQGREHDAMRAWRGLACVPTDSYAAACAQLARVVPARLAAGDPVPATEIARVLKNEQGRWWDLSYDRLKRFGYRFDSY